MGAFLQNRLIISGIRDLVIIKTHDSADFTIFQPRMSNDTIYVLQILDWLSQHQNVHPVMMVDFETIHHCFGHPSREALKYARKHTENFPEINIPSNDPTCPVCA